MLRNFLTALFRFRMVSLLNLMGLTTAYVAFIVIGLQVLTEYSHDKMYPDHDRIYRVESCWSRDGGWRTILSRPIIDEVVSSFPEIEESAIIYSGYSYETDQKWSVEGRPSDSDPIRTQVIFMSTGFPEMFGLKILAGEGLSDDPKKILIPQSMVERYFGHESPLGKVLVSPNGQPYTVNGVYEDFPLTSSFANNLFRNAGNDQAGLYNYKNYELFLKLRKGTDMPAFVEKLNRVANQANNKGRPGSEDMQFRMTLFSDAYFAKDISNMKVPYDTTKLKLFGFMALLILLIAAINYINFAMALVPSRVQSLNTRKMFGASMAWLRGQLVCEAVVMSLLAYFVAVGIVISFKTLDAISFIPTTVHVAANWTFFGYLGLLAVGLGILAGVYPAFYSTSFKTAYVLKGTFSLSPKGRMLRTLLVGFQFVISIGLIVSAMFMNLQFSMIRNQDLGVDKENILQLSVDNKLAEKIDALKSAFSTVAGVEDITFIPGGGVGIVADQYSCYAFGEEEKLRLFNIHGTNNLVDFFGLKIVEGRDFMVDDDLKAPNSVVLINRSAQKKYNLKIGDRLGELNSVYNGYFVGDRGECAWEVVGVVADFNFKPLYEDIAPLIIVNYGRAVSDRGTKVLYLKVRSDDYPALIKSITTTVRALEPSWAANVSFLDDRIEQLYKDDLRSTSLIGWFSFLAILISLAGVFGLVLFEVRCRRKEIGLRKINGASSSQILSLLSRKFMLMAVVCYVIATPMAVFFVGEWLKEFAYRTPLHWWVFALAMVVMLALVLLTVIIQAYRTAKENPVDSVKTE